MDTMRTLFAQAKDRKLSACEDCPRNNIDEFGVFASCCPDHFSWDEGSSMIILRDPSRNNAAQDQRVCCICHREDPTAVNLNNILLSAKIDTKKIFITNAVLCGSTTANSAPSVKIIKTCSKVIKNQIDIVKPRFVLTLGREAAMSIQIIANEDHTRPLRDISGKWVKYSKLNFLVFHTYHPSGRYRQGLLKFNEHMLICANMLCHKCNSI